VVESAGDPDRPGVPGAPWGGGRRGGGAAGSGWSDGDAGGGVGLRDGLGGAGGGGSVAGRAAARRGGAAGGPPRRRPEVLPAVDRPVLCARRTVARALARQRRRRRGARRIAELLRGAGSACLTWASTSPGPRRCRSRRRRRWRSICGWP